MSRVLAVLTFAVFLLCQGCGGAQRSSAYATLRPACAVGQVWHNGSCTTPGPADDSIKQAVVLISEARFDDGLALLARAATLGPHLHRTFVALQEQLGLAYSYVDNNDKARAAFTRMLAVDPQHQVSYDVSPKALFQLEKVRLATEKKPRTQIAIRLPSDLNVERSIPVDVEVVGDPTTMLHRATLYVRSRSKPTLLAVDVDLPKAGKAERVVLPPLSTDGPDMLRLHLVGYDKSGNQVLLWESRERPREVSMAYTPRVPWFKKWWVWALAGSAVGIGTGVAVYVYTREPPDVVGGSFGTLVPTR